MASPAIQPVLDIMTGADTVMDAAVAFIGSVPGLIDTAVAGGIADVQALSVTLKAKSDALAAALATNTPQPPPTPAQLAKAKGR